jgi:hypothetical protein
MSFDPKMHEDWNQPQASDRLVNTVIKVVLLLAAFALGWLMASAIQAQSLEEDSTLVGYVDEVAVYGYGSQDTAAFPAVSEYRMSWMQDLPQDGRVPYWGTWWPGQPTPVYEEEENLK